MVCVGDGTGPGLLYWLVTEWGPGLLYWLVTEWALVCCTGW